ncbi:MAG: SPOR domain-containing protein [Candidatus Margulisiibacteriota bacterium]
MAEEFLNINPPGGFPPPRPDDDPLPEERPVSGGLKNLFVFLVLVLIVAASFFVSFQLGSRILSPVKKTPEAKIAAPIPEPPESIRALQRLQAALSTEAKKAVKQTPKKKVLCRKQAAAAAKAVTVGKGYYKVQAGLFADKEAAKQLADKLSTSGFDVFIRKAGSGWRVQVGAYRTKAIAEELRGKLAAKGFSSHLIYE